MTVSGPLGVVVAGGRTCTCAWRNRFMWQEVTMAVVVGPQKNPRGLTCSLLLPTSRLGLLSFYSRPPYQPLPITTNTLPSTTSNQHTPHLQLVAAHIQVRFAELLVLQRHISRTSTPPQGSQGPQQLQLGLRLSHKASKQIS